MNHPLHSRPWNLPDIVGIAARAILAATFIGMGISKALDPVDFLKLIRQYDTIAQPWLLNLAAGALPWFEIFCGILLLIGVAGRGAAVVLLAMLAGFTAMIAWRGAAIADMQGIPFCQVRFDCGCGAGIINVCRKLIENGGLILAALWLAGSSRSRWALRWSWSKEPASLEG
ncbi:MAG TPA: DoxX family protein [Candidatus Paceibacterota bacterium]|nr:DoxX family protein [Verrucomicrobiota bacterium]HOX01495.1 DoxX family protein [Verrucomicrobiota bacterium]HRZ44233.1 DoxX family protein [Candidatus Paceibacterota bacterium]HRZ91873.1 DoxX family protein [Candidatus Paceibacterota bacterium]